MRTRSLVLLASLAPCAIVSAQATPRASVDLSVAARVSTLGIGGEVSKLLTPHLGVRVGVHFYSMKRTFDQEDLAFDATLKMQSVEGLIDLYPGKRGAFHFTGGIMTNPASITGIGVPSGSIFEINDKTYSTSQVGTLNATGSWSGVLPYVGMGFGTPATSKKTVRILFDIGAAIGKAKIGLTSSGAANNPTLQADLNAQVQQAQDDANKIPVFPVISLGLAFRF